MRPEAIGLEALLEGGLDAIGIHDFATIGQRNCVTISLKCLNFR